MVFFEELFVVGYNDVEYDVYLINIGEGVQFSLGFVDVNFNLKIFVLMDYFIMLFMWIFEFGVIFLYLVEKFNVFFLSDFVKCFEMMFWLFW